MASIPAPQVADAKSAAYFSDSSQYLRKNHRITLRREIVQRLVGPLSGARVLDMGCGNGAVSLPFLDSGNEVTMLDRSTDMLREARDLAGTMTGARFVEQDVLAYQGTGFDLTLCIGVLAHVPNTDAVIEAVARTLRPGGRCVIQLSPCERKLNRIGRKLSSLRNAFNGSRWAYQNTNRRRVLHLARWHGLHPVAEQNHLLALPGLTRALGPLLVPYDRWVQRHPALARHGLDTLILFEKR